MLKRRPHSRSAMDGALGHAKHHVTSISVLGVSVAELREWFTAPRRRKRQFVRTTKSLTLKDFRRYRRCAKPFDKISILEDQQHSPRMADGYDFPG